MSNLRPALFSVVPTLLTVSLGPIDPRRLSPACTNFTSGDASVSLKTVEFPSMDTTPFPSEVDVRNRSWDAVTAMSPRILLPPL